MTEEMKTDTMDLCVNSYEKHSTDHEVCHISKFPFSLFINTYVTKIEKLN